VWGTCSQGLQLQNHFVLSIHVYHADSFSILTFPFWLRKPEALYTGSDLRRAFEASSIWELQQRSPFAVTCGARSVTITGGRENLPRIERLNYIQTVTQGVSLQSVIFCALQSRSTPIVWVSDRTDEDPSALTQYDNNLQSYHPWSSLTCNTRRGHGY